MEKSAAHDNPDYEQEPAERRVLGSVQVDAVAWWSGALTVPDGNDGAALLKLTRHGPEAHTDGAIDAVVRLTELPAVATLVGNLARAAGNLG
jgi:hypothetical protein